MTKTILYPGICIAALLASSIAGLGARQAGGNAVQIDADDIGGVVTSAKGTTSKAVHFQIRPDPLAK